MVVVVHAPVAAATGGQGDPIVRTADDSAAQGHNLWERETCEQIEQIKSLFPDHLRYPSFVVPSVGPGLSGTSEMLTCELPCCAVHRIELDQTPRHWLGELLTLVIGRLEPWEPAFNVRLQVLPSYSSQSSQATIRFWLLNRCLVFPVHNNTPAIHNIQAENDASYSLSAENDRLVISGPMRQWTFAYQSSLGSWRLEEMGMRQFPRDRAKLVYDDANQLQAIELPNGERVQFTYRDDRCAEIQLPFGQLTIDLSRNDAGYITRVACYRSEAVRTPVGSLFEYRYEHDPSGRLTSFTNARNQTFAVEYVSQLNNPFSGDVWAEVRAKRQLDDWCWQWRWQKGRGIAEQVERVTGSSRQAQLNNDADIVGRVSIGETGADPRPLVRQQSLASARSLQTYQQTVFGTVQVVGERLDYVGCTSTNSAASKPNTTPTALVLTASTNSGKSANTGARDGNGRILRRQIMDGQKSQTVQYFYGDTDNLDAIQIGDARHDFRWDTWGHLIEYTRPDGGIRHWRYDRFGQIAAVTDTTPATRDQDAVEHPVLTCEYAPSGALLRAESSDGVSQQLVYDARGLLTQCRFSDGTTIQHAYDRLGRLIRRTGRDKQLDLYTYQPGDLIASHSFAPARGRKVTQEFNLLGQRIAEDVPGVGRTLYAYDAQGRLDRITYPDGTAAVYTYDEQGQPHIETLQPSANSARSATSPRKAGVKP
ncbi:MAG: hypothetical protein WC058_02175 [Phycisphaeraceae bacterium]